MTEATELTAVGVLGVFDASSEPLSTCAVPLLVPPSPTLTLEGSWNTRSADGEIVLDT